MTAPLEAKYKIGLLVDEALASIKRLKAAYADLNKQPLPGAAASDGTAAAEAQVKRVSAVKTAAAKADAGAQKTADKEVIDAQKVAARKAREEEAEANKKAQLAQRAADQKARDEKRAADKKANFESYQARQLAPQLTDITVGLATGQNPFTVLLQQGGQLKDVFGGVGNAFRALGSIFTPFRVAVGGVVAALGTLVYSAFQGHQESDALNKSLALTGNIAGVTAGSLDQSARKIAAAQNTSIGAVREALASAVASGEFIGPTLDSAGRAAVALAKLTGKSAADQIEDFKGMSAGVADWASKQNKAYNFLTAEEYKHIRSLEAAGREQEAMRLVLDKLSATMEQRAVPAVGLLEKVWNNLKKDVSDVADALKSIGRDTTVEDRIAALQGKIAQLRSPNSGYNPGNQAAVRQADAEEAGLLDQLAREKEQRNRDLLRKSESSIDSQKSQEEIRQQAQSYQDSLAQVEQAGSKKILSEQMAGLDRRQDAVESANARGVLSAEQYNLKLNAIEQQRTQAQLAEVNRQISAEAKRSPGTPEQVKAQEARLRELNTQLGDLQSKLQSLSAQGRAITDAYEIDNSTKAQDRWVSTWERAADQVRAFASQNAEADAGRLSDPVARADAEAAARVDALRKQLKAQQGDLKLQIDLSIDPRAAASMQAKLDALTREGNKAINEEARSAKFASLLNSRGLATDALRLKEEQLDDQVQQGTLTTEEAERRKFAARDQALPQLEAILQALRAMADTAGDRNAVEQLTQDIDRLKQRTTALNTEVRGNIKGGFGQLFGDIVSGSKSALGAFQDFLGNVAKSVLNMIGKRLGEKLFESLLGKGTAGGNFLDVGINFIAGLFHSGGVVGSGGGTRALGLGGLALATALSGAPRYHSGGISGVGRNEELAVLMKGEEVLTEDNPRHIKNLRANAGKGSGSFNVGDVNISVKVEGAQGSQGDLSGAGDKLAQAMRATVNDWAVEQSREGGILARRS